MEDSEPYDGTDDCCRNEEDKRVPRQIPDAKFEPFGPDPEQEEEEGETDAKDKPEGSARLCVLLLHLEDVEAGWINAHVLHR